MKGFKVVASLLILTLITFIVLGKGTKAQTLTPPITIESTLSHTNCILSTVGLTRYCFASDGLYISLAGAAYVQLQGATSTGVVSFNGRTGAVTSLTGDYSYSQLSNPPTSVNCPSTGPCVIK